MKNLIETQDIDPADGTCHIWPNGKSTQPNDAETLASIGRKQCRACKGTGTLHFKDTRAPWQKPGNCYFCGGIGSFKQ